MVVAGTWATTEPDVGSVPESSLEETDGVIRTEVALVVAQVSVVVCPAPTEVGLAANDVTCGGAEVATCTVALCGGLEPPGPVATAE